MEIISDFIKILIPAVLVIVAFYLGISSMLKNAIIESQLSRTNENLKILTPIKIQAYERMILFLERINPQNLILRLNGGVSNAIEFQQILNQEIREEFSHNFTQQLFISSTAWEAIQRAQQDTIALINLAAKDLNPTSTALELSKAILSQTSENPEDSIKVAIQLLKIEFNQNN